MVSNVVHYTSIYGMFSFLLRECLDYIAMISSTITWYPYPCNTWIFFLPTAPSILPPGLGSKDGWEQAQSPVVLHLASLGS